MTGPQPLPTPSSLASLLSSLPLSQPYLSDCPECLGETVLYLDASGERWRTCPTCMGEGTFKVGHVDLGLSCGPCGDWLDLRFPLADTLFVAEWLQRHAACEARGEGRAA